MTERVVCDADVRARVTTDLGTTFLLEAGAGTGKTRVLVDRYVQCVLDPVRGTGDVRTVAAITFTEKAAGELRQRVRERFERLAVEAAADPERADVIRAALDALDDAPISTIHGFAGRLLREFPVEARVDPAFEQLDQLGSDLERARLWDEWLTELAAGDPSADPARRGLKRLLRAGVRLEWVRTLAVGPGGVFDERYDLEPVSPQLDEPDLRAALGGLEEALDQLAAYCGTACSNTDDRGCVAAMDLVDAGRRLLERPPEGADQLAAALFALPAKATKTAPGGAKGNWSDAHGGKDELQLRYKQAAGRVTQALDAYAEFLTSLAVAVADAFSRWAAATQLAQGRLDFTDLLGRLRDLLADDAAARAALQARFAYLLVDEFQDTDPLQAEIVFYLCERRPVARDWREAVLQPGKLFVVGDPKQSIYRFRRADIGMYDQVKRLVAGQPDGSGALEVIRQNFRTTPAVVNWVNNVFSAVFDDDEEEGRQPGYQWVEPYRPPADGPRVAVLLGDDFGSAAGAADAARRAEAQALAALLLEMHGAGRDGWSVQDREAGGSDPEVSRPPCWGDVAILFRATTGLETYEQAFREAGVPYRVDGGKAYFARREVDDLLLCLRAVDDPSDGPALYGALHSTLFGFSDDDLFLFWAAGGRFDLFAAQPEGHEAVAGALATLRDLHARRASSEPHELAAALVRVTRAAEVLAATGSGGPQAIANLEKLVDRARAFSGAGGMGLGAFLAWAAEAGDAAGEPESQVDDDGGDVVHLLTIHKAKGLEYPIVILAGGALGGGGGGGEPIVDREERRLAIKLKAELPGAAARDLEPDRYTRLREREKTMEASEGRRLLYVATTRARDRLVVTCFGRLRNKDGAASAVLLGPAADALPAPAPLVDEYEDGGLLVLPPRVPPKVDDGDGAPDERDLPEARRAWAASREEVLERARLSAPATSPSGLEHVDERVRAGGPGAPAGRARALALGSAVHQTLELCDLDDEGSLELVAAAAARELERPDIAAEAAELAAACWRAEPVRAAARAAVTDRDAVHREVPIGALVDGVVLSGAVDLLYRDGEDWVVVDYKTDRGAEPDVLLARYRPQGAAYALAAEAVLGVGRVREVCFVAARAVQADGAAHVVRVPVDDDLRAEARREIAAAAAAGVAVRPDELGADE